ncbi:MAG: 1-deoxy-D-xylulose-5-phosphate reductoisomerase [Desulfuromonas sp.]|nr:MAG: 1-deoxy-D-xylulose-5-phosphate reductoisomerase [Desulfuromonas sp.]
MKQISILGSTGSIGVSTLQIVRDFPDRFDVVSLTAGKNITLLAEQIRQFRPAMVAVVDADDAERLSTMLDTDERPQILSGVQGLIDCACAPDVSMVVAAIVGAAGLRPTLAAIEAGKDIALANKETLVTAGSLVIDAVARSGVKLLPVDSEHSAIFQSLEGQQHKDVRRLILTASGGPFRETSLAAMEQVTPADALAHPNWDMGRKISIDSATMMNKGLEVIEARWLFDLPVHNIAVHIHPESIIHSMVEFQDGALIAQMGVPDMQTPIAYALSWPDRLPLPLEPLDLCRVGSLNFFQPDPVKFPCLDLAYQAGERGGTAPAIMNAANEVAVDAFLEGSIGFLQISRLIEAVLEQCSVSPVTSISQVIDADRVGRSTAQEFIDGGLA